MRQADIQHASTLLVIRSANEDLREISGTASTPTPDRYGDVIEPLGVKFVTPLPLLVGHDHTRSVGSVVLGAASKLGVHFKAVIAKIEQDGPLKSLCDDAWASVKAGLLRSVSIGFRPLESEPMQGGGVRFTKWEWLELSLCAVPAQPEATITDMRAFTPAEALVERQLAEDRAQRRQAGLTGTTTSPADAVFERRLAQFRRRYPRGVRVRDD
ncbi:HK97 family phage prohead protease [Paraburkholderia sprentiae WSM5005]|uniref:HK97 family phage prohead protease n=1 Tax=Paraburkholderia sprentiae WSM5005 TaxID=754502 RepID=A0A1I9YDF1_9BURK|nr:HK97 family phage prohead protease [Paraburkholderia sprentiae]APA84334.2 HK97 family phage prohead protease [Paraburkholderia sprentiae WSM5005]